ncbi:MAG: DUF1553 domain-containing protein [Opitutus sp.]
MFSLTLAWAGFSPHCVAASFPYMRFLFTPSLVLAATAVSGALAAPIDYNRDVRPIIAENCYQCHGQDAEARKGKLRLDTKKGQAKDGIIVAGEPDDSELIGRIFSTDSEERMPPEESHRTLNDVQKETLRRWIAEGAPFAEHWAFTAPQAAPLPEVKNESWARGPIDRFVLARIEKEGLTPAPETEPERWLRRVTFDLTGLPPTLAEIAAIQQDRSKRAYEGVVDRLLASPRYGERMAADWLDIARYADTHGYQMDRPRAMWPYRDWVIGAFNRNLPYDQFLTEQLAGDLLPEATRDQHLATAFNRLHAQNEEGGIVDEEYRVAYVNDRVVTFGTAVLGLSFDCTRCHDHKFDPLTQKDFYSLSAFFQNIDENGAIPYKEFSDIMPTPVLKLPDPAASKHLTEIQHRVATAQLALTASRKAAKKDFQIWLARRSAPAPDVQGATVALDFDELDNATTPNQADPAAPAKIEDSATLTEGVRGKAGTFTGENGFSIADAPVFTRGDAFSFSVWVRPGEQIERAVVFHRSLAYADAASRGYELVLENGRAAFALNRSWPGDSLKVVSRAVLPPDRWTHVTLTYDGSSQARGARIYLDGLAADVEVVRDKLKGDITYDLNDKRKKQPPLIIGYRFRDSGFNGGRVDEFRAYPRELTSLEAAQLAGRTEFVDCWTTPPKALTATQRGALREYFERVVSPTVRERLETLAAARRDYAAAYDRVPEVMVMEELPQPRPAFVLERGSYDRHGPEVKANTPAVMPPMPADVPHNRLGLARWATSPQNPLTARVAVNRLWQMMFERGLVESSDNFGATGSPPTHPELLDWLAVKFVESGWDMKAMLRDIALSATYRQSSHASAELRTRDPQNLLLARAPARRLTAEMIRDEALAFSGLLVERIGGPPVKPYQPPGIWEEIAMGKPKYEQGTGEDLHRRTVYTFLKRTVPPPALLIFDASDRSNCTVRRQATSTPLQALALLNDTQLIEAARFIGARMLTEGGPTPEQQAAFGFRLVTSRAPRPSETASLAAALKEQELLFASDDPAATKLLSVGEADVAQVLPRAQLAAATMVATLILNFDEAVMRR